MKTKMWLTLHQQLRQIVDGCGWSRAELCQVACVTAEELERLLDRACWWNELDRIGTALHLTLVPGVPPWLRSCPEGAETTPEVPAATAPLPACWRRAAGESAEADEPRGRPVAEGQVATGR